MKTIHTLIGLPVLAFALAAPVYAAGDMGGNAPRTGTTDAGTTTGTPSNQMPSAKGGPMPYAGGGMNPDGGNTRRTGTTDSGTTKGKTVQQPTAKNSYGDTTSHSNTASGKKTYNDRSGGVGTGAGSSENLGSSNPGGGVNSTGSGNGKP